MDQQVVGGVNASGVGTVVVHIDARPNAADAIDRLSWTLDAAGRELFARDDIRDQLRQLMTWPGRVSGWRRASFVWAPDVSAGSTFIYGVDNAAPWPRPGVAPLDPLSIVGSGSLGAPPTLRSITLSDRHDHLVVAAICLPAGVASLCEMVVAESPPTHAGLAEIFPAGHDFESFEIGGELFDRVHPASVYTINSGSELETGVLLADASGAPRAWICADFCGDVAPTLGISRDNALLCDSWSGRTDPVPSVFHMGALRRAAIASQRSAAV